MARLPLTHAHRMNPNPIEQLFWHQLPIVRATSFFFYDTEGSHQLIHLLKYHDRPQVGRDLAEYMATELRKDGFFDGIDLILPVPLHWRRRLRRGYNQSDYIAQGISCVTGIPIERHAVQRVVNNPTQTHKNISERRSNVEQVFRLVKPERVAGCHVLLVDDVLTTGATAQACGQELCSRGNVRVSVLTLAYAGSDFLTEPLPETPVGGLISVGL